jgi:hypothetical protein
LGKTELELIAMDLRIAPFREEPIRTKLRGCNQKSEYSSRALWTNPRISCAATIQGSAKCGDFSPEMLDYSVAMIYIFSGRV